MLVRGGRSEILIDLDGDREADLGLFDSTGNGNIDTLAADVLDTGEFNLVILDRDDNGIPDAVYLDEEGTGNYEELAVGPEVEAHMLEAAHKLAAVMEAREIIAVELEGRLRDLEKDVRAARKELKAGR